MRVPTCEIQLGTRYFVWMSKLLNDNNPLDSVLKEGIVIGIIATLRELLVPLTKARVAEVLRHQQGWSEDEIEYFLDWILIFNIEE